jgi:hypothetical protein
LKFVLLFPLSGRVALIAKLLHLIWSNCFIFFCFGGNDRDKFWNLFFNLMTERFPRKHGVSLISELLHLCYILYMAFVLMSNGSPENICKRNKEKKNGCLLSNWQFVFYFAQNNTITFTEENCKNSALKRGNEFLLFKIYLVTCIIFCKFWMFTLICYKLWFSVMWQITFIVMIIVLLYIY